MVEARIAGIETAFAQQQNRLNEIQSGFQTFGKQMEEQDFQLRTMLNEYDAKLKKDLENIEMNTEITCKPRIISDSLCKTASAIIDFLLATTLREPAVL